MIALLILLSTVFSPSPRPRAAQARQTSLIGMREGESEHAGGVSTNDFAIIGSPSLIPMREV